ncbi:EF-hand [Thelephora ganbajun]|uniref:EF-hand n=1 Tax=Thelephora ganbajun TaxID=370292 RepID=A0ACB6ZWY4_THEGA|nr:EF-hand [Thelephora ganbajun]
MLDPRFNDLGKDEYRQAFEMFDEDGSGSISITELKEVFRSIGQKLDDEELELILKEADRDGDREIDYEEFLQMMQR